MDSSTFAQTIAKVGAESFIKQRLQVNDIPACSGPAGYDKFKNVAATFFGDPQKIFVMGSGNLGYSLNPLKDFRPFGAESDIDLVVVSLGAFQESWNEMRSVQRKTYYTLNHAQREQIMKCGKNVYCGFISPDWIPDRRNAIRYKFAQAMNALSCNLVGFRKVGARIFRNQDEVVDYYKRSVVIAMEKAT